MFPNISRYIKFRHESKDLPEVEVTEEEFVRLMMEAGQSEKEAKFQAFISKGIGGATRIGDRMVKVKKEDKNERVDAGEGDLRGPDGSGPSGPESSEGVGN